MKETIKQKPLILITNDDGVEAPGLRKLISIARKLGDVAVVALQHLDAGVQRQARGVVISKRSV